MIVIRIEAAMERNYRAVGMREIDAHGGTVGPAGAHHKLLHDPEPEEEEKRETADEQSRGNDQKEYE